ncbi:ecto-NOX disulfide-thiol exchanger 2-like [Liolophura sinensis]|uniref:ecto-NOX disulfide-thiol exchanger 2-like n=1 Tax=Liolophura sinensis TaxID=3198878 RepID=UPI003158433D
MDRPLEFNMDKMGRTISLAGNGKKQDRAHQAQDVSTSSDIHQSHMSGGDGMMQPQMMGMMGGPMGSGPMGPMAGPMGSGPMGGMGYPGAMNMMTPDPSMMMMGPMGGMGFNQFGGYMGPMGQGVDCPPEFIRKDVIELKFGVLYPPPPGAPPRSRREKPPGCRTIFVGSLPEGVTEENIYEIFERFGNILSVRLNKNNYCHIRYEFEDSVEMALLLSGYTLKIESDGDAVKSKHIHVDYAQARDDQYEWECLQRALARENRHRQQIEEAMLRPPSPPPVLRYSEYEAQILLENLKNDETFMQSSNTLLSWLTRGECSRKNANVFYSLIQTTNAHVRRLLTEKENHEQEIENMKANFRQQIQGILRQFEHIERIFSEAQKQRASDHFSKAQRKSIDVWCKQIQEIKQVEQDKFLSDRHEDEMEMSDTDQDDDQEGPATKRKKVDQGSQHELYRLRDENDSLKCQLEAYKNEIDIMKQDLQMQLAEKDKQIKVLQQALQGMQQQLISFRLLAQENKKKSTEESNSTSEKTTEKVVDKEADVLAELARQESSETDTGENLQTEKTVEGAKEPDPAEWEAKRLASELEERRKREEREKSQAETPSSSTTFALSEKQTKIIGLVSCFLHVHPFGASTDYLWSYLQRLNLFCRPSEIEDLMERLPMLYKIDLHGVGASIERRWKFIGYAGFN